jgi:hypothetical protein
MGLSMRDSGKKMRLLVTVSTNGLMADAMWVIGRGTLWTHSGSTLGKMVECMKDSTKKTKNTVMGYIPGLIRRSMLVGGVMASSMVLVSSYQKRAGRSLDSGKMARSYVGSPQKRPGLLKVEPLGLNSSSRTRRIAGPEYRTSLLPFLHLRTCIMQDKHL